MMENAERKPRWQAADANALRPAAYWFWSHIPSRQEARSQLRQLAAAGFGTVLIQTRRSFPLALYMTDAYLAGYRMAVREAGRAGLTVGVYDEYCWISGHGGGRTVHGADHLRERHLFWATSTAADQRRVSVSGIRSEWIDGLGGTEREWLYEGGERRWDQWRLVAALAHPAQPGRVSDTGREPGGLPAAGVQTLDLTAWASCQGGPDGATVKLARGAPLPEGWILTAFISGRCASSRLVNYLDRDAAERFLKVVYEPYARALAGLLGDPVRYFSFDHPYSGFYDWDGRDGVIGNSLMWLEDVAWLKQPAPDGLGRLLWEVIHDRGEQGRRARCEFFADYSGRAINSFFKTLERWTQAHGVGLTGHEYLPYVGGWGLNDGFPAVDGRVNFGLDHFAIDAHRSQTLVDAADFNVQISPCIGASVARAHGREGCIVEQYASRATGHYAAGYWELSPQELRMQALRLALLGAHQFLFHAFGQSDGAPWNGELLTNPRFDFPPAINFEPWFGQFREIADELAAVSAFIQGAASVREVAIVYPLHTIWADGPDAPHARLIGEWARLLAQAGVGFDLIDDRALPQASIAGSRSAAGPAAGPVLHVGSHDYTTVILAGVTMLPAGDCVGSLRRFAAAGGSLLGCRPLAPELERLLGGHFLEAVPATVPEQILRQRTAATLASAGDGTLWSWQGRDDHGLRVVLLNDSSHPRSVELGSTSSRAVLALELDAGAVRTIDIRPELVLGDGWTLNVEGCAAVPVDPSVGWEHQGFATFAGSGLYRNAFNVAWPDLDEPSYSHELILPEVHTTASVRVNGLDLGTTLRQPHRFNIPAGLLRRTGNVLEVEVRNSAANRYYAGSPFQSGLQPSGLAAAPVITSVRTWG
ncbi:MAG: hypothetical protein ACP5H2_07745 [Solirubrobacteraceae bacterium]